MLTRHSYVIQIMLSLCSDICYEELLLLFKKKVFDQFRWLIYVDHSIYTAFSYFLSRLLVLFNLLPNTSFFQNDVLRQIKTIGQQ